MTDDGAGESAEAEEDKRFTTKVRWVIPHRLDFMTFIGKDVCAVAHDVYITFYNLKYNSELVYVANNQVNGDGIDCIAAHRSKIFAFAEKLENPRIFIVMYPSFIRLAELKDNEVNRYKGLCMMENDLICGFSGFPNYVITVWSWRTGQRLLALPTNITRRDQMYMASRTHMLICECYHEGLIVWEVAPCYKKCFMMKRAKEKKVGWEVSEPPLIGICWSNEGQLYAIDDNANLFSILSDGIDMVSNLEWSENLKGANKPYICSFGNGLLIYGPDKYLRSLKKCENKWKVVSQFEPHDEVVRLISNSTSDLAAMFTAAGLVYKITGESEEKVDVKLVTFKQRNIKKIQLIAPHFSHVVTMDDKGVLCIFDIMSGRLEQMKFIEGSDVSVQVSPVDPLLAVIGKVGHNYGMALVRYTKKKGLEVVRKYCLTHQIVSNVAFSPTGREIMAAAMSAGHVFIFQLSLDFHLKLVRYLEVGRGLADCFLMKVGDTMRAFSLVLFSDKYAIGERIVCINAETGKDNKFAGKMQGPYCRLLPLSTKDTMLAIPHLSKQFHLLKLSGEKGITISVKMGPIVDSCHDVKHLDGFVSKGALLTYGFDGNVIGRPPDGNPIYDFKLVVVHRYDRGVKQALIDDNNQVLVTLAENHGMVVQHLNPDTPELQAEPTLTPPDLAMFHPANNKLTIINASDKNYLDIQEDKKVHEEHLDFKKQREEVVRNFREVRAKLVELLEENINERPLHQLPLSEFNLHLEHKKERLKQAEKEREEIRLNTEAKIKAQDKVTAWIKKTCWDTMLTPRVKLFAIFSHYQVENYAVLPTQRENWPELQQVEALRTIEMENDGDLFRPWEEFAEPEVPDAVASNVIVPVESLSSGVESGAGGAPRDSDSADGLGPPPALWASRACLYAPPPHYHVPQMMAYTYLQMNWLQHIVKLNVQNMRLWFNKQFDDLMNQKKREVGLVSERNARLRFIIEELNKLSDLRGSFHHLTIQINDPEWQQEEQPQRLIKVDPEECSIEPYISPSQVVVPAVDPGPKDDFRERALVDMMDGVLEKLWHEEIKKPIPMPNCMLEKDPEHFNEDDLRLVFEYEAKVAFRNEERDKYRKMLHAEYAKLSGVLNEGVVKFNQKVKEMWLTKLQIDSVIGQENLSLMRMRRVNLDRLEMAEELEHIRKNIAKYESEIECLQEELKQIQEQSDECQTTYDALAQKDKYMERTFKNHFADLSPIIVDQCYKYYKKRPKWHQRASMSPWVLHELAAAVLSGLRPPLLHLDVVDYFKGMEQLDLISNMPPVMDEGLWATMCKLRRAKVENEIRMRAVVQETSFVDACTNTWSRAVGARRAALTRSLSRMTAHRQIYEDNARNKTIQLVLPAGQVEVVTTGHIEDFDDATLIPREDIEKINNLILKVGEMKLAMMRKQMDFRRGILAKEWEHAQMKMKLRHMEQELYSYKRLKIPKELQYYLKDKELGITDEQDYVKMEKEMEASKMSINRQLTEQIHQYEELELKMDALKGQADALENLLTDLNVKVSEKRLTEDPFEPIRIRRVHQRRLNTLVQRSRLIREVQDNHTTIVLLQTQLELLRLKTYPTLASFRTLS